MDKHHKNILLTISLLVSNSKDTIRRTMESIRPILEKVPSECIVVDTGGTDGAIDIAREYTNNVVPFTWCDDFSAARNAGLKRARGQWFLFLDDDEWFEDVTDIIQFFNSGEYKKYNCAYYIQRNYQNEDINKYTDVNVSRAVKLEKNTRFVGAIHEFLDPVYQPIRQWNAYVHHYGYVYSDKEEEEKKHQRNVNILLRELQRQPKFLRNHAQLAQEYGAIKNFEQGIAVCRNAIQKYPDQWSNSFANWMMWGLVLMLRNNNQLQEAWEEGWQILETCNPSKLAKAHISYVMVRTAQTLPQDSKKLLDLAVIYFDCIEYLSKHREELYDQEVLSMTYREACVFQWGMAMTGLVASCQTGEHEKISFFLSKIEWKPQSGLVQIMEDYKKKYPNAAPALTKALSQVVHTSAYISLQRLLAGAAEEAENLQDLFDECVEQCYLEKVYYPQVIVTGVEKDLDFLEMFAILDQEDWESWVYAAGSYFTTKDYIRLGQIVEKTLSGKNYIQYTAFLLIVQKYMIMQESALNDTDFLLDLEQFCDNAHHYFTQTYQETMFRTENMLNLPRMCRFAIHMNKAFAARKEGKYKDCIVSMREALAENPSMKDVIEGALGLMESELEEAQRQASKERMRNEEFALLAKQIKARVKQLIEEKAKEEALQVIAQLQMLLPDDSDVAELKEIAEDLPDA